MRLRVTSLSLLLASALTTASSPGADDAARRAAVVARVGDTTVTVSDLEQRIAAVPPFQLRSFGADDDTVRHRFLNEVVLPEILLASGAEKRNLAREVPIAHQIGRAKSQATIRAVRASVGPAAQIPMDDVRKFYDDNKSKYDAPERINVWRIVCKSKDEAAQVLDAAKKDGTPKTFEKLAREHSLDKGTYLRGGNLGFLMPDGTSNEAGLKVDPEIVNAASTVKDGELVPGAVKEGDNWAVVWRRGSIGASHRSVDDAAAQIRDALWKQRVDEATTKLEETLRASKVRDVNYDLLTAIDLPVNEGSVVQRRRPGQVAPASPSSK